MKKYFIFLQLLFIFSLLIISCAKIGSPSGGQREVIPPVVLESNPKNSSTNFNEKKIVIEFDEFIQLIAINQKLIISPFLPEKPEILAKGKKLHIDLNDNVLKENTTYTISFSDAICDIHENTPILNYNYVFSTGNNIDSLQLFGEILDSYTLLPLDEVYIFLYTNTEDSVPYKEKPFYLTKTNKKGKFVLQNLNKGEYKIFALKDANSNMLFDQPTENIAFLDSLITVEYVEKTTVNIDDSIKSDSTITDLLDKDNSFLKLFLFVENSLSQYIKETKRIERRKCDFIFEVPLKESVKIIPIYLKDDSGLLEICPTKDTVTYWLKDSSAIMSDTISFAIQYTKIEKDESTVNQTDTVLIKYSKKKITLKAGKKQSPDSLLVINANIQKAIDIDQMLKINCGHPINKIDSSKISFINLKDSLKTPVDYVLTKDSVNIKTLNIVFTQLESSSYKLVILPNAFIDIFELTNDTLNVDFTTKSAKDYGNLSFIVEGVKSASILQLTNIKGDVILENYISKDTTITYNFLKPNKYGMRLIEDTNNNKKWDTGKYLEKQQPEKVIYFNSEIIVKPNWDAELKWNLED